MTHQPARPVHFAHGMASTAEFLEHERLDVYRAALEFVPLALSLVPRQGERVMLDQLERASQSIVLNIAEGAGRHARGEKRRFYEIAKGSALECAAILDVLRVRGIGTPEGHAQARALIIRIAQMLRALCDAQQGSGRPRRGSSGRTATDPADVPAEGTGRGTRDTGDGERGRKR
jgi:four helix bundle protein